jgi:hypothetical protein
MLWTMIAAGSAVALAPGIYTNEEQVYFAAEAGKPVVPWTGLRITAVADGLDLQPIDAFGKEAGAARTIAANCGAACGIVAVRPDGVTLRAADGSDLILDRAAPFTCWAAIRKRDLATGSGEQWHFARDIRLHDAGGRALVTSVEPQPQSITLRMRDVAWSSGPNRPSLVLYVHTDDPARAVSYAWADPGASRGGHQPALDAGKLHAGLTLTAPRTWRCPCRRRCTA